MNKIFLNNKSIEYRLKALNEDNKTFLSLELFSVKTNSWIQIEKIHLKEEFIKSEDNKNWMVDLYNA